MAFPEGEKLLLFFYALRLDYSSFLECFPYAKRYLTLVSFMYRIGKMKLFPCFPISTIMNA